MKLSELFTQLAVGELDNLALSENNTIVVPKRPMVVLFTNEALLRLYTRFVLKEKNIIVQLVNHITNYHFLKKHARSQYQQGQLAYPYLFDLPAEPFQEDLIKILSVYNSHGHELPLNDDEQQFSLFTPQMKMLQVSHPVTGLALSVLYQARHVPVLLEDLEAEIELPDVLHSALRAYIAHKVYGNMNTDVSVAKSQEHLGNFEILCNEALEKDLLSTSISTTNVRFHKRGWI